jgi:hypothetical protein
MRRELYLLIAAALLAGPASAALPRTNAVPGGVIVVDLGDAGGPAPKALWQDRAVLVTADAGRYKAVVGVALAVEPGDYTRQVTDAAGAKRALPVKIAAKKYREQRLTVAPGQVDLSPQDAARVETETVRLRASYDSFSATLPATFTLRDRTVLAPERDGGAGLERTGGHRGGRYDSPGRHIPHDVLGIRRGRESTDRDFVGPPAPVRIGALFCAARASWAARRLVVAA